jgi:hypothetical protein
MSIATTPAARIVRQSAEAYHGDKRRISRSQLVDYIASPWLYYMRHVERHPDWQQTETDDMRFGTLIHSIALEQRRYEDTVKLIPEHVLSESGDRRGKAYMLWASITEDAKSYRKPNEVEGERKQVESMMASLHSSPAAMALLCSVGHPVLCGEDAVEVGIHWEHDGIELRTRLDRLAADCIIDLKTARSCDLGCIERTIETAKYHVQAACYQMAVEALTGETLPFKLVFIEKSIPYRTVVVNIDQEWIDAGRREIESALKRLQHAFDSGDWRDPVGDAEITMTRPNWTKYSWALVSDE